MKKNPLELFYAPVLELMPTFVEALGGSSKKSIKLSLFIFVAGTYVCSVMFLLAFGTDSNPFYFFFDSAFFLSSSESELLSELSESELLESESFFFFFLCFLLFFFVFSVFSAFSTFALLVASSANVGTEYG